VVRSPEQVALELPIAGPTSRILAYAFDLSLMLCFGIGVFVLAASATPIASWLLERLGEVGEELSGQSSGEPAFGRAALLLFAVALTAQLVIELFYFVLFETVWRGRTPGKRLLGLGVVSENGLPVSFGASLVRNLLRSADILPSTYTTGLVAMLVSKQSQRLGDIAAGTVVVRFDRPLPAAPLAEGSDDDARHFPFSREQLARVGSVERRLVRQTLRRIERLPSDRAEELATRSARALSARIGTGDLEPGTARAYLLALHSRIRRRASKGD
jgi:uncharacterized RDD family membrane protein YckC